jgi:hypothetical protein
MDIPEPKDIVDFLTMLSGTPRQQVDTLIAQHRAKGNPQPELAAGASLAAGSALASIALIAHAMNDDDTNPKDLEDMLDNLTPLAQAMATTAIALHLISQP